MSRSKGFRGARLLVAALCMAPFAAVSAAADPVEDAIAHGEALYAKGSVTEAYAVYGAALQAAPTDVRVLYRMAQAESDLGEDANGEERRKLIASAVEHARAAVKLAPENAQCHVWLAVALGRQALKEGPKARLALAREIKSEADRGIALDERIGRAWHVLAVWNREVASLSFIERAAANTVLGGVPAGASMDNAVHDFEKAIALEPQYVNHHLELGRTLRGLKRWAEARRELETAIALAPTSNPRDPKFQAEARELLARLPHKG